MTPERIIAEAFADELEKIAVGTREARAGRGNHPIVEVPH